MAWNALLSRFNWVDIFIVIILFRSGYIGIKQGFVTEIFKLLGIIIVSAITLHWYPLLGEVLSRQSPLPLTICESLSYLSLGFGLSIIFVLARYSLLAIIRIEAADLLNRWGGLILGLARGIFVASFICLFFFVCNNGYLKGSLRQAYSGERVVMAAPIIYRAIFNGAVVKFSPRAELNNKVFVAEH